MEYLSRVASDSGLEPRNKIMEEPKIVHIPPTPEPRRKNSSCVQITFLYEDFTSFKKS